MPDHLRLRDRNGYWYVVGTIDGQQIRRSLGTRDRDVAESRLGLLRAELLDGYNGASHPTVADALALYRQHAPDQRFLDRISEALGHIRIDHLDARTVADFAATHYASIATQRRQVYTPLLAALRHGERNGLGTMPRIAPPRMPRVTRRDTPSDQWYRDFWDACERYDQAHRDHLTDRRQKPYVGACSRALTYFLTTTLARCGEAVATKTIGSPGAMSPIRWMT